jgi:hypothetical protein
MSLPVVVVRRRFSTAVGRSGGATATAAATAQFSVEASKVARQQIAHSGQVDEHQGDAH